MKTQMARIMIFLVLLSATEGAFPDQHAAERMNGVPWSQRAYRDLCGGQGESCLTMGCCPPLICSGPAEPTSESDTYQCQAKGFSVKPLLPVPFFSLIVWWFSKPSPITWFGDY